MDKAVHDHSGQQCFTGDVDKTLPTPDASQQSRPASFVSTCLCRFWVGSQNRVAMLDSQGEAQSAHRQR